MRAQYNSQCLQKNGPDVCLAPPGSDGGAAGTLEAGTIEWPVINLHSCIKSSADRYCAWRGRRDL